MRIPSSIRRKPRAGNYPLASFQSLEKRELLTTYNVTSYGANPAPGNNDLGAVQAAINASGAGDTIFFPAGTYELSGFSNGDGLTIPGDRTYLGEPGSVIKGHGSNGQLLTLHQSDATFYGLTFDGGGIFVDKSGGGFNQNLVFDFNTFLVTGTSGSNRNGITFTSGLQNTLITNNLFTGYGGGFGIYGYNYNTLTIANNEFVNIGAGMHIDAFGSSGNLLVEQNYLTGVKGMGLEFQSTATNLVFQDNWYEHPNLSTVFSQNNTSFAYSLILDKSSNINIRRNVIIAPERPDGVGCRVGFEVGGDNTLVEDNYINGVNHTLAVNDGVGTASVVAQNNRFMNYLQGSSISFPSSNPSRTFVNINDGPNTTLSAVMEARIAADQKPGIGTKRYDGTGDPGPGPQPDPPPTTPTAPTALSGVNVGLSRIDLAWVDNSDAETGYKVEILSEDGQWLVVATTVADATSFSVTGLGSGRTYQFRVVAFNDSGYSESSNTVSMATPVPDLGSLGALASRRARTVFVYQGSVSTGVSPPILPTA